MIYERMNNAILYGCNDENSRIAVTVDDSNEIKSLILVILDLDTNMYLLYNENKEAFIAIRKDKVAMITEYGIH